MLGFMYEMGAGVDVDYYRALGYYEEAEHYGYEKASQAIEKVKSYLGQ